MAKKFMSFLGTGKYEMCSYTLRDKKSGNVKFIQDALIDFCCQSYTSEDSICIFLTKEAREKHWKELDQILVAKNLPCQIKDIDINDSKNEADVWALFNTLYESMNEKDEITFDLTHSFRYLPMLFFSVLNYAQYLKHIKVEGVYYGAYEIVKDAEIKEAPVFDMLPSYELMKWASAADAFTNYGAADKIVDLVKSKQDKDSLKLAKNINKISETMNCSRGYEIVTGKIFRDTIAQIEILNTDKIEPFKPILNTVTNQLAVFESASAKNFIPAVEWYIEHNMLPQSVTMLQEGILTYLMEYAGLDYTDRDMRSDIGNMLSYFKPLAENKKLQRDSRNISVLEDIEKMELTSQLKPIYGDLANNLRNDVSHGGFTGKINKNGDFVPIEIKTIKDRLNSYFTKVKNILAAY